MLDFCLWWSSWSQLRCLQKFTSWLLGENSRLRKKSTFDNSKCFWKPACYTLNSFASLMLYSVTGLPGPSWISVFDLHLSATHQWPNPRDQASRDRFRNDLDQHVSATGLRNTCEFRVASMSLYEAGHGLCSLLSYRTNGTHERSACLHRQLRSRSSEPIVHSNQQFKSCTCSFVLLLDSNARSTSNKQSTTTPRCPPSPNTIQRSLAQHLKWTPSSSSKPFAANQNGKCRHQIFWSWHRERSSDMSAMLVWYSQNSPCKHVALTPGTPEPIRASLHPSARAPSVQQVAQKMSQRDPAMAVWASHVDLQRDIGQMYINDNASEFELVLRTLHAKLEQIETRRNKFMT